MNECVHTVDSVVCLVYLIGSGEVAIICPKCHKELNRTPVDDLSEPVFSIVIGHLEEIRHQYGC